MALPKFLACLAKKNYHLSITSATNNFLLVDKSHLYIRR